MDDVRPRCADVNQTWVPNTGLCSHTVLLRLPSDVAKLGKEGAQLSCMQLALRDGVWRPVDFATPGMVLANVYPP